MFSNLFAAEGEEVNTPSYLDRIIEAAESAKDRVNEISEEITNTVAEISSPKDALESLVTSAKDAIGEFSLPTNESDETVAGDTSEEGNVSPFAALIETARNAMGEFTISARESVVAVEDAASSLVDSAKGSFGDLAALTKDAVDECTIVDANVSVEGSSSPRDVIAAYAATAKNAIFGHAVALKETVAESIALTNEPTYYVETTYEKETSATGTSNATSDAVESIAGTIREGSARVSEFALLATDAVLSGATSTADIVVDGVASAKKTVVECVSDGGITSAVVAGAVCATESLVEGVSSATDTVFEGAKAAVEAALGEPVTDADSKGEANQSNVKSAGPISTGTALALIGAAALPAIYVMARKSE